MKKEFLVIIILLLLVSNLLAKNSKLKISLSTGCSMIFSKYNPQEINPNFKNYYYTANFGLNLQLYEHIMSFNYKNFNVSPKTITLEVSNEVTGKEFIDFTLTYGRCLYSFKEFKLDAFVGIGVIQRKINHLKASPKYSEIDKFLTVPISLKFNQMIFKKIGLSTSIYAEPNFVESLYGFDLNLFVQFK